MLAANSVLQGRYKIVRAIGQGGMGAVYEAKDLRLGHTVAVKELLLHDSHLQQAFEEEARRLAPLRHAALPNVSDHFTEDQGQYLVMEYISGNDLGELIKRRGSPFEVKWIIKWDGRTQRSLRLSRHALPLSGHQTARCVRACRRDVERQTRSIAPHSPLQPANAARRG